MLSEEEREAIEKVDMESLKKQCASIIKLSKDIDNERQEFLNKAWIKIHEYTKGKEPFSIDRVYRHDRENYGLGRKHIIDEKDEDKSYYEGYIFREGPIILSRFSDTAWSSIVTCINKLIDDYKFKMENKEKIDLMRRVKNLEKYTKDIGL